MSNYVNNLNELINTKNEFKEIIIESGQTPGEVFSYYPNMIRNAIAAGGGSLVDYPTYTYVATYYPDFTYLFSYVGDALSGIDVDIDLSSYVTYDYANQNYFNGIQQLGEGNVVTNLANISVGDDNMCTIEVEKAYVPSYAYIESYYATLSQIPVINESIIPQENNTYTLGDSSHIYSNTYSRGVYLGTGVRIFSESSASSNDMAISLGGVSYFYLNSNRFSPNGAANNEKLDLGTSDRKWNRIYGKSVNVDTAYLQDTSYTKSIVPAETAAYTLGDADHLYARTYTVTIQSTSGGLIFRVGNSNTVTIGGGDMRPNTDGAQSLGRSSNHWNNGYINNIYTENVSYTSDKTSIKMNDRNIDFYANNKKMINLSDYNGFVPIQTNVNLGGSSNKWGSTYTSNLYADTIHNFIWTGTSAEYAALDNYTSYQIYLIQEA